MTPKAINQFDKFVFSLSFHVLTESEESLPQRRLNFAVTNQLFNSDVACAAESAMTKLPPAMVVEFCWRILYMLEKSKLLTSNIRN